MYASRAPLSSSIRGRGNEPQRLQPPGRLDRAQAHETEPRSINAHVSGAFPGYRDAAALANRLDTLGRQIEPPPIAESRIDRQQQLSALGRRKSLQSLEGPLGACANGATPRRRSPTRWPMVPRRNARSSASTRM